MEYFGPILYYPIDLNLKKSNNLETKKFEKHIVKNWTVECGVGFLHCTIFFIFISFVYTSIS